MTLIPWKMGRSLIWDVTVADSLAASYLSSTSVTAGAAAEQAALRKHSKYQLLSDNFCFVPVAFETLGPFGNEAIEFINILGSKITETSGDPNETKYLFQHLSLTIQRFNSISTSWHFFCFV